MKSIKYYFTLFLLLSGTVATLMAQDLNLAPPESNPTQERILAHKRVFHNAMTAGDLQTATVALHYLVAEDPGNSALLDTLALFYYQVGNANASRKLAEAESKKRPQNIFLHGLLATIAEEEGQFRTAQEEYQTLFQLTSSPYYLYQEAVLEFRLSQNASCRKTIASILALKEEEQPYQIRISSGGGQTQLVPVKAAALNLLGNLEMAEDNNPAARKAFTDALEIYPEFLLAKGNLDAMED